jgi:hypothetical protein
VVYFNVKPYDIWEENVITRTKSETEIIPFLKVQDVREEAASRKLILRCLECNLQGVCMCMCVCVCERERERERERASSV